MLCFEVGIGQADSVKEILNAAGFTDIGAKKDLNGIERAVYATYR